jgi:hypothetical protein
MQNGCACDAVDDARVMKGDQPYVNVQHIKVGVNTTAPHNPACHWQFAASTSQHASSPLQTLMTMQIICASCQALGSLRNLP